MLNLVIVDVKFVIVSGLVVLVYGDIVKGVNFEIVFDFVNGVMKLWKVGGCELLLVGFCFDFWCVLNENDCGN